MLILLLRCQLWEKLYEQGKLRCMCSISHDKRNMRTDFFSRICCTGRRHSFFKLKDGPFWIRYREDFLCNEHGQTLGKVAHGGDCCPSHFQGQVGWGSEQPDLEDGVPAHGWGLD